jgi:hypothetical protein
MMACFLVTAVTANLFQHCPNLANEVLACSRACQNLIRYIGERKSTLHR